MCVLAGAFDLQSDCKGVGRIAHVTEAILQNMRGPQLPWAVLQRRHCQGLQLHWALAGCIRNR